MWRKHNAGWRKTPAGGYKSGRDQPESNRKVEVGESLHVPGFELPIHS